MCFSKVMVHFAQSWRMTCTDSSSFSKGKSEKERIRRHNAGHETAAGDAVYMYGIRARRMTDRGSLNSEGSML